MRINRLSFVVTVFLFLGTAASLNAGPIGIYYLTDILHPNIWKVQGSTATAFQQQHWVIQGPSPNGFWLFSESAIAVDGTIRTLGTNQPASGLSPTQGAEYTRSGQYTGTDFAHPSSPGTELQFYDATTDGSYIYSINNLGAAVWRMDMDWSNPTELFKVDGNLGITYDRSNGSLWVSSTADDSRIVNYSMTGQELSSFVVPATGANALALDWHDDTLWFVGYADGFKPKFYQYSKDGLLLHVETYAGLDENLFLGGEFAIPEPASLTLFAIGGLGAWCRRLVRRRVRH